MCHAGAATLPGARPPVISSSAAAASSLSPLSADLSEPLSLQGDPSRSCRWPPSEAVSPLTMSGTSMSWRQSPSEQLEELFDVAGERGRLSLALPKNIGSLREFLGMLPFLPLRRTKRRGEREAPASLLDAELSEAKEVLEL